MLYKEVKEMESSEIAEIKGEPVAPAPLPGNMICFSHLRWNFVYQRPQHLISRFSGIMEVYFVEEPVYDEITAAFFTLTKQQENLWVIVPHLPPGLSEEATELTLKRLLDSFLHQKEGDAVFWYYTPMALGFTAHLRPKLVVYDCMDELAAFKFAPPRMPAFEEELFRRAQVVFTAGESLYREKKKRHPNVSLFPSSVDKEHFMQARQLRAQLKRTTPVSVTRLGFFGVIDERFDSTLIHTLAMARPEWDIILIGPVVKIDPATLPRLNNIYYLGMKPYKELPYYLSGWDLAMIPFLLNRATCFISPTKTPEYLAAGLPVISTPIADVVSPYGEQGLVRIVRDAHEFIAAAEQELAWKDRRGAWQEKVDDFLGKYSWDQTWQDMVSILRNIMKHSRPLNV